MTTHILQDTALFERFAPALSAAEPPVRRDPRLLMDSAGDLTVYYAPFEYVNREARIVLVGITPGPTQMVNANNAARMALSLNYSSALAIRAAKETGGFSGEPLRGNLLRQLNHWGVHTWLGLSDASDLFGAARDLAQTSSLLRYPVFERDQGYLGTPDMTRHPLLRRYLMEHFAREAAQMPDALFFALGPKVQAVLEFLVQEGVIARERVVLGMLHPSGNNTYRIDYLVGDRNECIPYRTNPSTYDSGRTAFSGRHAS